MTDKEKIIKELKEALDSLDITNKYRLNLIRVIEYLQKEPEITHEIIGKVIKAERKAVWDDARLLEPRLTTEEALIIEIFKLINNE